MARSRKRLLVALGVWLAVMACVPHPQGPRDVDARGTVSFIGDDDVLTRPRVYGTPPEALTLSNGEFTSIVAEVNPDGSYFIPQVPGGAYYLKDGTDYLITSQTSVDLGFAVLGRSDARKATATRVVYN